MRALNYLFIFLLFLLGVCFGSFLCCQARRLHLKEKGKKLGNRSVCLNCGYKHKWYDNLPILSWLFLRGRCRKCHQKIGLAEILSEFGVGLAFTLPAVVMNLKFENLLASPIDFISFGLFLLYLLPLAFLAIYDGLYGELPSLCLTFSIICAIMIVTLREWDNFSSFDILWQNLLNVFLAALVLAGTYLVLYLVSKGKWVGDGDWLLALSLSLVLGSPWRALLTLFLANFLACLVMLPSALKSKNKKIYFGPFLIVAFILIFIFPCDIISI